MSTKVKADIEPQVRLFFKCQDFLNCWRLEYKST